MPGCIAGYHAHGGDTKCHPIKKPHPNPATQRYHDLSLQDSQVYGADTQGAPEKSREQYDTSSRSSEVKEQPDKTPKLTPTEKARRDKAVANIKSLIKRFTSGKDGRKTLFMFYPITMLMSALDYKAEVDKHNAQMKKIIAEREAQIKALEEANEKEEAQRKKDEEKRKKDEAQRNYEEDFRNAESEIGDVYGDTYSAISEGLSNLTDPTPESVNELKDNMAYAYQRVFDALGDKKKQLMERYGGDVKKVREMIVFTKEYQQWKAYEDYLTKCEITAKNLEIRFKAKAGVTTALDGQSEMFAQVRGKARSGRATGVGANQLPPDRMFQ